MRRIYWAAAAFFWLAPTLSWSQTVTAELETCESSSHLDIESFQATFDDALNGGTIIAVVKTCGAVNPKSKGIRYFVYLDADSPTILDEDRDGDPFVNDDACAETADKTYWWGGAEPSQEAYLDPTDLEGSTIVFEIPAPDADSVYLWAAAGNFQGGNGVVDRAPNTNRKDKCDKPQSEDEALKLALGPGVEPGDRDLECRCWEEESLNSLQEELGQDPFCVVGPTSMALGNSLLLLSDQFLCQIQRPGMSISMGLPAAELGVCRSEIELVCGDD